MANKYLLPVYKRIFDEDFSYGTFDQRLKMQKAIYLMQELGVSVGDYGFTWYKHGPYSQSLLDDMHLASGSKYEEISFSSYATHRMQQLHDLFATIKGNEQCKYGIKDWSECLASIHYLKSNFFPAGTPNKEIEEELQRRKKFRESTLSEY